MKRACADCLENINEDESYLVAHATNKTYHNRCVSRICQPTVQGVS